MSEENKKVARSLWEAGRDGDLDRVASLYDENVLYHGNAGEERRGRDGAVALVGMYKKAFPDLNLRIEQMIAEGDFVFSMVRPSGTFKGELQGMAPTGKSLDVRWLMNLVRISNGKIVEEWEIFDQMDFLKQLGVMEG
jgi:steroid delta-isomerase-like uncharacterized protein